MEIRPLATVVAIAVVCMVATAAGQAIPAPDIPTQCNSIERCCMPTPYTGKPGIRQYKHNEPGSLPWRVRRPAHLLTDWEIKRLEKAYSLMRALPDTDPRSLLNQRNLHCLYCDNALEYPGQKYPLEIHNGWFFLPWHRMFLLWHERILAKLLGDDTFFLPYWAWDNTNTTEPTANTVPLCYAKVNSSLWDVNRNNCSVPPFVVDLDTRGGGCSPLSKEFVEKRNDRLLYNQIVLGSQTSSLMFGMPYRFGDWGGAGPGTIEDEPHGPVHAWMGNPAAMPPRIPFDDMGNFGRAAYDPIFYAHHSNMDRMWWLWSAPFPAIPGGNRSFPMDKDFNHSQFTFYDEDANLVKMNVSDVLDAGILNYRYEDLSLPWVTNGVAAGKENSIKRCNPLSKKAARELIRNTPKLKRSDVLSMTKSLTFRVKRPKHRSNGTQVLQLSGIHIPNVSLMALWKIYVFFPNALAPSGPECPEYAGSFNFIPHTGQANFNPKRVWRLAIDAKLRQLGLEDMPQIVVTLVQTTAPPGQNVTFSNAKILYDHS